MTDELGDLVVLFIAHELRSQDFHSGRYVQDLWMYRSGAEDRVNRMTNVELLNAAENALRWRRDGGDIGL